MLTIEEVIGHVYRLPVYLALGLVLAAPGRGWAVGSFSLSSSDVINATTMRASSTVSALSGLTFNTVTVGTVSLALELQELGTSLQSPHHNAINISDTIQNTTVVASNVALVTAQQAAGGANVSLSVNTIIAGAGGLSATTLPSVAATNDPTMLLSLVANPAFATLNSHAMAQALLLREAFKLSAAVPTNAIAIDVLNVGTSQFSPHHNAGQAASAINSATVNGNAGFVTVQQSAGFANVQASINTVIVGSGVVSTTGLSF